MEADEALWWAGSFALVLVALFLSYALFRLGRMLQRVDILLHETTDEVVPVIGKVGQTVDTVNDQLRKVDRMMDNAIDVTESVDGSVRALSMAITEPVKKIGGLFAGATATLRSLRGRAFDTPPVDPPEDPVVAAAVHEPVTTDGKTPA